MNAFHWAGSANLESFGVHLDLQRTEEDFNA